MLSRTYLSNIVHMLLEGLQILYTVGHSGIHLVLTVTVFDSYTRILLHEQWTLLTVDITQWILYMVCCGFLTCGY